MAKEQSSLLANQTQSTWTKTDYILLLVCLLVCFGDGIELYLPGVITQYVSCEIGVSELEEAILGCVLYFAMGLTAFLGGPISDRFGRRETVLLSLYGSSLSTVLCAVAGSYSTIVVITTRALIGAFMGLNKSLICVLVAEWVSSKQVLEIILLASCFMFTFGGVWVPCLAYLFLEMAGWRIFIVFTSVPFFIPPIFILHSFKPTNHETGSSNRGAPLLGVESKNTDEQDTQDVIEVKDFKVRLCKMLLWKATTFYQGWGTILLLPALIHGVNLTVKGQSTGENCDTATQGWQFLLLALVHGAANVGRIGAHLVRGRVRFRVVFCSLAVITVASYTANYFNMANLAVIVATNFAVKLTHGAASMETIDITYNVKYFGKKNFALGCGIATGVGVMAGVSGTAMASFVVPSTAVLIALVVSALQVIVVLSMTEPDQMNDADQSNN